MNETAVDATPPDGERKTVTALFADIKGSTALMEGLDPEAAHAIVDPVLRIMVEAVHRYGGYVVRSTGDGIFALFGTPGPATGRCTGLHLCVAYDQRRRARTRR
jgi:class 3 adenylate cyclase